MTENNATSERVITEHFFTLALISATALLLLSSVINAACTDVTIQNWTIGTTNIVEITPTVGASYDVNCSNFGFLTIDTRFPWFINGSQLYNQSRTNFEGTGLANLTFTQDSGTGLGTTNDASTANKEGTYLLTSGNTNTPIGIAKSTNFYLMLNMSFLCRLDSGQTSIFIRLINVTNNATLYSWNSSALGGCADGGDQVKYTILDTAAWRGYQAYFWLVDGTASSYWYVDNITMWDQWTDGRNFTSYLNVTYPTNATIALVDLSIVPHNMTSNLSFRVGMPTATTVTIDGKAYAVSMSSKYFQKFAFYPAAADDSKASNMYKTYLVFGSELLTPTLLYLPNESKIYRDYFDNVSGAVYAPYNEPAYYYVPAKGSWYFLPPYAPSNLSLLYTSSVLLYTAGGTTTSSTIGVIPIFTQCTNDNTSLRIIALWNAPVVNYVRYTSCNSTDCNVSTVNIGTAAFINITATYAPNYTQAEYIVNGFTRCYSTNSSAALLFPFQLNIPTEYSSLTKLMFIPLLFLLALTFAMPFMAIVAILFNDVMGIMPTIYMAPIIMSIGVLSAMGAWNGEKNLKALIFMAAISIALVISWSGGVIFPEGLTYTTPLSSLQTQLSGVFSGNIDIVALASAAVNPIFIIQMGIMLLTLPGNVVAFMGELITLNNPAFTSFWGALSGAINVGLYAYLIIKLYEVFQNRFRPV